MVVVFGETAILDLTQATCYRSQIKRFNTDQTSISNPTIIPKGAISAVLCYGHKRIKVGKEKRNGFNAP